MPKWKKKQSAKSLATEKTEGIHNTKYSHVLYVTEHAKRAQLTFKIILSFSAKLRLRSILGKMFLAAIQYLQQFTYLRMKF